ncbi:MAG TPA: hypothetical protein VFA03_16870 [Acetobacteraceae bacterium]|nr:hypothetical protein [Acetobacteraceae bacterium]
MSTLRMPRLLPVTIFVMALALGARCAGLAGAASAADEGAAAPPGAQVAPATEPRPAPAPAAPVPARPAVQQAGADAADLARRRADLEAREASLRERQSVIAAAEQKLEQRVAELKALQAELEKSAAARDAAAERQWNSLVQLYEKMKPRDAARILDGMDTDVVVTLIGRMKELRAAPILAAMSPDRARDVTGELASRTGGKSTDKTEAKGGG